MAQKTVTIFHSCSSKKLPSPINHSTGTLSYSNQLYNWHPKRTTPSSNNPPSSKTFIVKAANVTHASFASPSNSSHPQQIS